MREGEGEEPQAGTAVAEGRHAAAAVAEGEVRALPGRPHASKGIVRLPSGGVGVEGGCVTGISSISGVGLGESAEAQAGAGVREEPRLMTTGSGGAGSFKSRELSGEEPSSRVVLGAGLVGGPGSRVSQLGSAAGAASLASIVPSVAN